MPETRESKASYLVLKHVLASLNNKGTSMALESIEIDATDNESSCLPRDHPARQGLPCAIDLSSTVKRGTNKSQTFVYPEMWRTGGKAKSNMPVGILANLSLEGIQWLTHTSIQLYSRAVYENTIKIVDKKIRKFRVGTALVLFNLRFSLIAEAAYDNMSRKHRTMKRTTSMADLTNTRRLSEEVAAVGMASNTPVEDANQTEASAPELELTVLTTLDFNAPSAGMHLRTVHLSFRASVDSPLWFSESFAWNFAPARKARSVLTLTASLVLFASGRCYLIRLKAYCGAHSGVPVLSIFQNLWQLLIVLSTIESHEVVNIGGEIVEQGKKR
ncbi:hypothetical protein B0H14DRAFT_2612344 [Mycena olivaceomarginata]|nr:hypothetical protein B0H14DRAFT_2612344 [Mycena olivaceomarginata]